MLRRPSVHLVACTLATLAIGCRALDRDRYHALLEAHTATDATDASADAEMQCMASTDGGTTDAGCHLVTIPPRNPSAQDLGPDAMSLVFAVRSVTFGFATSQWQTIGYDRDGYCTQNPDHPAQGCRPVTGVPQPVEDGEGGRDNALGSNLGPLFTGVMFNEGDLNSSLSSGDRGLGVRLRSFGGGNDAQVIVEWLPLVHGRGANAAALAWDGSDVWAIDARLAYDSASPGTVVIRSNAAYTMCGTLVARLPARVPIRFAGTHRQIRLTLSNAVLTGPVDPLGHSFGPIEFSAYWPLSDALTDLGVLGICPPTADGGTGSSNWDLLSSILTSAADLLSTGESSPAVECDALSAAFRMEFVPITLGADESSPAVPEDLCGR